ALCSRRQSRARHAVPRHAGRVPSVTSPTWAWRRGTRGCTRTCSPRAPSRSGRPGHDAQPDARDPLADGPPMHIVQFHHVRLPVFKYGGGERIVVWLCQGLVERGHQVTLLAPKGSRIAGVRVVEVSPEEVLSPGFDLRRYVSDP